jgi:integrase
VNPHKRILRIISGVKPKTKGRQTNKAIRIREYLTTSEVEAILEAARNHGYFSERNVFMIKLCYNHALRISELLNLDWSQIDLGLGTLLVVRAKGSVTGTHYLSEEELNKLREMAQIKGYDRLVFPSRETGKAMSSRTFQHLLFKLGKKAGMPFTIHPHMLRHAKGFALANKGADTRLIQGYLGHKNIANTVLYTELSPHRFKGLEAV